MNGNGHNHDNHEEIDLDIDAPAPQYYTARAAVAPSRRFKISDDGDVVPAEVLSTDTLSITITDYDNEFYMHDNEFGIVDSDVGEHASDEESDDEDAAEEDEAANAEHDIEVNGELQSDVDADAESDAVSDAEAEVEADEEVVEQEASDDSGPDELPVVAWPTALQSATTGSEYNVDLTIDTAPETALDETPLPSDTPTPPTSSTSTQAQEPTLSKRALKRQRKKQREQDGQQQPQGNKRQRTATTAAMPAFFQQSASADAQQISSSPTEVISRKYWAQRYSYWSKFDLGIKMDSVGWYSVTPEAIAKHQAERCRCDTIIDAFAGVGGNAIAFAQTCMHVIAIELDPVRLACAKHNARVYGVADRIEFILGSYYDLIPKLKADVVFLSPPWGGPAYIQSDVFDIATMIPNNGVELYRRTKAITSNICYCLPRNCDRAQIESLAALPAMFNDQSASATTAADSSTSSADLAFPVDIEENLTNGRVKMLTVYYNLLAGDSSADTSQEPTIEQNTVAEPGDDNDELSDDAPDEVSARGEEQLAE